MKILCHRGYWKKEEEKNTLPAIKAAFESGRGIESDIRDCMGRLVVSHNPAAGSLLYTDEVFELMRRHRNRYCFAINIKSDGLGSMLAEQLKSCGISNYFTFDMSVPQMIEYRENGITYFSRQSEYEKDPVLYDKAAGVWIDAFYDDSWINEELIRQHHKNGKNVCIVSPDLHRRGNEPFWDRLQGFDIEWNRLLLCTDFPDEAQAVFSEKIQEP